MGSIVCCSSLREASNVAEPTDEAEVDGNAEPPVLYHKPLLYSMSMKQLTILPTPSQMSSARTLPPVF